MLALAPVIAIFEPKGLSLTASTTVYFFTFAATLFGRLRRAVLFGHCADRMGRRRTTLISIAGFGVLIGGTGLYYTLVVNALAGARPAVIAVLTGAFCVLVVSPWGIVTTYISERFPTHIRASGYGTGYSAAVVIPAFTDFYLLGLASFMPYVFTPMVLLGIVGVLMVTGVLMGPETREVDLHAPAGLQRSGEVPDIATA